MPRTPTAETETLIASDKVEDTAVFNADGEKLGSIRNFMVDKESGQVEYAVMEFGGLLGAGTKYYPVPWVALEYDEDQGGYVIDVDKELLENAPSFGAEDVPPFTVSYGEEIDTAYDVGYEDEGEEEEGDDADDTPPPPPGVEHFVRHNPTAALVGALVVGVLLGRIGIL